MRALADVHAVKLSKSPALTMAKPKLFQFNNAAPGSGTISPGIATVMVYSLKEWLLPVFAEVLHVSMMGSNAGNIRHQPG